MEYLTDKLKRLVAHKVLAAPHTFMFLDFDGTLTPIVSKHSMAGLHTSTSKVIEKLLKNSRFSVGIITGRMLKNIRSLIKLKGLTYAGNHGLELHGLNFDYTHAKAIRSRRIMNEISVKLKPLLKRFRGSSIENKGVTVTYHYRLMDPRKYSAMRAAFSRIISPRLKEKRIRIHESKKAFEVRPNLNWNKGSAVRWILLHEDPESFPIYIGDDMTDESAFRALRERGVTIRVGFDSRSHAQYYVNDTYSVERFLSFLTIQTNIE